MTRLPEPTPGSVPGGLETFLATLPSDPMVSMMALSSSTAVQFVEFARTLFTALELPARTRELVVLTVAATTGAVFVQAQHDSIADAAGGEGLSESDAAVIRFARGTVQSPRVSDALFTAARELLGDRQVAEVIQVVGYYWAFGRISTMLDVPVTTIHSGDVLDTLPS
jgi:alkylhydroperoxidase family enzyme